MIKHAPGIFKTYYDTGTMTAMAPGKRMARIEVDGAEGFTENLWEDTIGGIQGALEAAGAKEVTMTVMAGGTDGDTSCVVDATWR